MTRDDTPFVGIPADTVGVKISWDPADLDWKNKVVDKLVLKLIERLN